MPEEDLYDVIVIGGGPAGSTAAIYAARAGLRTLVIDKGLRTGSLGLAGQIANYPGMPGPVPGAELLERMRNQARGFGTQFLQDRVLSTDVNAEPKSVWSNQGLHRGRALIVATGSLGRSHTVPGEERLTGAGVSYCAACDGAFFRDERVAVAGNNEEAVDEALFLTRFAHQVHLLVQTPSLDTSDKLATEAQEHPKIAIYRQTRLTEIVGEQHVEGVVIRERGEAERQLPVSGVFVYVQGREPITDFLYGQLDTTETGCLEVDDNMQTNVPGVFAVGDVLCNHLKQAVVSASEGAQAAMAVERHLSGRTKLRPDWSHS